MPVTANAAPLTFILIALLGCTSSEPQGPFTVTVRGDATSCFFYVDGKQLTHEQLISLARREVARRSYAHINAGVSNAPFRCVGGTIFELQQAGFKRVGFVSEPPDAAD